MGLFSRNRGGADRAADNQAVPPQVLSSLADFGEAAIAARVNGGSITDSRFSWNDFIAPVRSAFGVDPEGVLRDIHDATDGVPRAELAACGGYLLLAECDPELPDARFLAMQDAFLDHIRSLKLSSGHLNRYEADRWIAIHGDLRTSFDGIYEVTTPAAGQDLGHKPLEPGKSRILARMGPGEDDNRFFAERLAAGGYLVYSERIWSADDPTMKRCEESQLGTFDSLPELLKALGRMFGTPTYWADEDLMPYFPARRG